MLKNAVRLCNAKFGNIHRWDGDVLHLMATHNTPPAFAEYRRRSLWRPNPTNAVGRAIATKSVVHVADLAAEAAYTEQRDPGYVAAVELGGIRTLLAVPMLKESELIGVFTVYRQEVRPFTNKQISVVSNFAAQAVIAIENARLLNELRQRTSDLTERTTDLTEALEQQTATSEVLRVISSTSGDLEPVFNTMLENATRICEAKFGMLYRYDGTFFHAVAFFGVPPAYVDYLRQDPIRPSVKNGLGRVLQTKQPIQILDIASEPGYREREPLRVATVELAGARTLVAVPMLKAEEFVGAIVIFRQEVRPFSDKQIGLVTNFAAQAVIAIENTRLLNELRARTDELGRSVGELKALGEVSQAVNSTLDLETVLTTIVGRAVQLSRTDAGAIYVFDEERKEFRLHATYGMSETMIAAITDRHIGLGDANIGKATTWRKPIQVPDIRNEPTSPVNEIILREGYRGILIIPLLRPDHIVGALVVRRKTPGEFANSTIGLLQTLQTSRWWRSRMRACSRAWKVVRANWRNRSGICRLRRTAWYRRKSWLRSANSRPASRTRSKIRSISSTIFQLSRSNSSTNCGRRLVACTSTASSRRDHRDRRYAARQSRQGRAARQARRCDRQEHAAAFPPGLWRAPSGRYQRSGRGSGQSRLSRRSGREAGLQYHAGAVARSGRWSGRLFPARDHAGFCST